MTTPVIFEQTDRFKELLTLLNGIKSDKFPLVLTKIIQAAGQPGKYAFTTDEENQLLALLGIETYPSLVQLIEGIQYLYETAAYHNMKSQVLGNTLLTAGCNEAIAVAIVNVWTNESANLIHKIRHRLIGTPQILTNSTWQLLLTMGNDSVSSTSVPAATLDLTLSTNTDNIPSASSSSSSTDNGNPSHTNSVRNITIDFTSDQLLNLLENLDTIQSQLDSLS